MTIAKRRVAVLSQTIPIITSAGKAREQHHYCAVPWEIVRDICTTRQLNEKVMRPILLIILIVLLIAALPTWPYSTGWGYYPSGGLGLILVIILLVVLLR